MSRILVVEDSPDQAKLITALLKSEGHNVDLTANGREALSALDKLEPDLILTDLDMPEMNGLELVQAVASDGCTVPIVLMAAFGTEETAAQALAKGAASYIPKRLLSRDLGSTLNRILAICGARRERGRILKNLVRSHLTFELENKTELVGPLVAMFEETLVAQLGEEGESHILQLGTAVSEALLNAIYHGNLELDSDLREQDMDEFSREVRSRAERSPYMERRVRMDSWIDPAEARIMIRDQGGGFDPDDLPDPLDPANMLKSSGRGLFLIRTFMDEVVHNEKGNEITMIKRFSDAPAEAHSSETSTVPG